MKDFKKLIIWQKGMVIETHLLIIQEQKWFPEKTITELLAEVIEEQKMLSAFINRIET